MIFDYLVLKPKLKNKKYSWYVHYVQTAVISNITPQPYVDAVVAKVSAKVIAVCKLYARDEVTRDETQPHKSHKLETWRLGDCRFLWKLPGEVVKIGNQVYGA